MGQGMPVVCVDSKCREKIGLFHQFGRRWAQRPNQIFDHDFPYDAKGIAIPYGIYYPSRNEGFVCVGTRCDTSDFAVDAIRTWWSQAGSNDVKINKGIKLALAIWVG